MAREYAKTNVTLWQDADWRDTPAPAQHLYLLMWTHPALNYCGVLDWRPGRLAQFAGGLTAAAVTEAGNCLQARHLIVVDDESEEALLRSWIRFDGLVGHDKLSVSMAKAFAGVASNKLRGVIVDELHKLREREPDLCGWRKGQVLEILSQPRLSAKALPTPPDPFTNGASSAASTVPSDHANHAVSNPLSLNGSSGSSTPLHQHLHQHPEHQHQEQASSKPVGRDSSRGTRIPEGFAITAPMREWAAVKVPTIDIDAHTEQFVDYWRGRAGAGGVKSDWVATWRTWMRREHDRSADTSRPKYLDAEPPNYDNPDAVKVTREEFQQMMAQPAQDDPAGFSEWWATFPRKEAQADARQAYTVALTKISADELLSETTAYAASLHGQDPAYIPYPAKWLNGERWRDERSTDSGERFTGVEGWMNS